MGVVLLDSHNIFISGDPNLSVLAILAWLDCMSILLNPQMRMSVISVMQMQHAWTLKDLSPVTVMMVSLEMDSIA